jgi:hypothetical protein
LASGERSLREENYLYINLSNFKMSTLHYYETIADKEHLPDSFLKGNNDMLLPWTVSYGIRKDIHHLKNITIISKNTQLIRFSSLCDMIILMNVPLMRNWLPDLVPVTPSVNPTLTLGIWKHSPSQEDRIRKHGNFLQRLVQYFTGNQKIFILAVNCNLSEVILIFYLCPYCPQERVPVKLTEMIQDKSTILIQPNLLQSLKESDGNLHLKTKGVMDGQLQPLPENFEFNSLHTTTLRDRIKLTPFLLVIYEMKAHNNFTPTLIGESENTGNTKRNFTITEQLYNFDKISANCLDIRINPNPTVKRSLLVSTVSSSFKRVIYCEDHLLIKSESKMFSVWLTPYDPLSWGMVVVFGLLLWICTKLVDLIRTGDGKSQIRSYTVTGRRISCHKHCIRLPARIRLVLVLGLFIVIAVYEGVITSRVIKPGIPYVYENYKALFQAGYKIYCLLVKWKNLEDYSDYYEVVLSLYSNQTFSNNVSDKSWWTVGENDLLSFPDDVLRNTLLKQKLALPIKDEDADHRVSLLAKPSQSVFCHLVPLKIRTGRLIWLFEGDLSNIVPLQKTFSHIFEAGIVTMYENSHKWFQRLILLRHDPTATLNSAKSGIKLQLKGKWTEIFYICAILLFIAKIVFALEVLNRVFRNWYSKA